MCVKKMQVTIFTLKVRFIKIYKIENYNYHLSQ